VLPVIGHAEAGMEGGQGGETGADGRGAVIALLERDELVLLRLAAGLLVIADEADRAVDRVGAAKREVDAVEVARRTLGEFGRQPDRRLGAEAEIARRIGQLAHLVRRGLDDAVLAVAGIHAPQARETVDELLAGAVGDGRALGRAQHAHSRLLMAAIGGDRMNPMLAIEFDQGIAQHGGSPDYPSA